jgi:hypothetical protein
MSFDITALRYGLVCGACVMLLSGCGNKGDLELVRKPAALDLPAPVSVPEEGQTTSTNTEPTVGTDGVVLDISEVTPEKKKKKAVSE